MNNQEIKLYAFQPKDYGQYSFFMLAASKAAANEVVEQYIKVNL
jgi:hypothetical protein